MKILLAHAYFIKDDEREKEIMRPYAPLGLLYISAYLKEKKVQHEVFDSTFKTLDLLKNKIADYKPSVLALYTNLMTKVNVVNLMQHCKKHYPDINIVLGGPDVRYNIDDYLLSGADFLVVGEGEESFYELLIELKSENPAFESVKGIAYKDTEGFRTTESRALLKSIDQLPSPAYDSIDVSPYLSTWKQYHGTSMMSVSTQRGCPYTCKWCSTAVYGQSYRRRSPEKVVEELKKLKEAYQVEAIWFVDDVFTVSHKWLESFANLIEKEELELPFECISRADRMNEAVIKNLKRAGCFRVWIGAESGSQKIIDAMDRRVQVGKVREIIKKTKKAGIETGTFIMLGYPGESKEDIFETIDHLSESQPDHFTITLAYPIKGTTLFDEIEHDLIGAFDWETQSDRERDFKRKYAKNFYNFSIRHVVNEVHYRTSKANKSAPLKILKYGLKSQFSRLLMTLYE